MVLDNLQDALSSLTDEVDKTTLPGYVKAHKDLDTTRSSLASSDRPSTPSRPIGRAQATPPTIRRFDWASVTTPPLSLPTIQQYHDYVDLRMAVSIESNIPITPSVRHVDNKARKASQALELNGVAASRELHRLQEKSLHRDDRRQRNRVITNLGPMTVGDARLRAAKDEHNRKAAKDDEKRRLFSRDTARETSFLRRWIRRVRKVVRASVTTAKNKHLLYNVSPEGSQPKWLPTFPKMERRRYLDSDAWMAMRYNLHR